MGIQMWFHILFVIMAIPALGSTNKLLKEKNAGNYDSEKLGSGLGFSFPSYGFGLGGGFGGDSNGSPAQRSDDSGFNFGLGFDLSGGNGYGGGGGSVGIAGDRPNNCHCTCDRGHRAGGISGKSNGKNEGNPPSKTVACRPMNCDNGNHCGGYSKRPDGSTPYWCKVSGKGIVPFWCNASGDSSGKVLNCEALNCPKGANCGGEGARYVLDIPVWVDRRIEPGHH